MFNTLLTFVSTLGDTYANSNILGTLFTLISRIVQITGIFFIICMIIHFNNKPKASNDSLIRGPTNVQPVHIHHHYQPVLTHIIEPPRFFAPVIDQRLIAHRQREEDLRKLQYHQAPVGVFGILFPNGTFLYRRVQ